MGCVSTTMSPRLDPTSDDNLTRSDIPLPVSQGRGDRDLLDPIGRLYPSIASDYIHGQGEQKQR